MTIVCDACQNNGHHHICTPNNYFMYYHMAKYFISTHAMYDSVNLKLARHDLSEMDYCEIVKLYDKVDNEWMSVVQAVISIIDL